LNLPNFEAFLLSQVLLVDDNPVQLQVREAILRNAGFRVSIATSAEIALALLRMASQHFGLVITDHIMPGTGGTEFVRRLRESGETLPVVVLSGLPDAEEEYAGLDVVFRLKPLPPPELIELVQRAIKNAA
jgi:CheY-like chemotaxis protein